MNENNSFEWRKYLYYALIGIISLIACVFLPMLGSDIGLGFNLPNTPAGWVVYIVTKLLIATINILMFYCFMEQAKVNVKDDPNYIEANEIMHNMKQKIRLPRSPHDWNTKQYSTKGITIFVTSILSAFALTNAILSFDLAEMLTYIFTIIMGLVFGIIQMKSAEYYWSVEYHEYAIMIKKEQEENERKDKEALEMAQNTSNKQGDDLVHTSGGSDILESSMGDSTSSNNSESMVVDSNNKCDSVLGRSIHSSSSITDRSDNGDQEDPQEDNK